MYLLFALKLVMCLSHKIVSVLLLAVSLCRGWQCCPLRPTVPPSDSVFISALCFSAICIHVLVMTLFAAPHSSHRYRRDPNKAKSMKLGLSNQERGFKTLFIHLGGGPMIMAMFISALLISFVSSNWVVINHQQGGDCKCNQAHCGFCC